MNKSGKKIVIAYPHTHWDREWYREFEEFRTRLIEVFDDVLEKLAKNEIQSFYFDGQTAALEDYLEIKPENKPTVEKLIKEKRLFIGPYYCSTDSFLVDSESLIKNLQLGINYSKEMGCKDFIAYHADTFGHSKDIPYIIKYFDIDNAIFWRGLGELQSEFLFNGLKSTYLIQGYYHDYFCTDLTIDKKVELLKRTLDKIAEYSSDTILLPLGADHMGIADKLNQQIEQANKRLDLYEIRLSSPFEYLKKVKNNYSKSISHEFRDTKRNFILPGVLSSRTDLKQYNSKLQWELSRITQPLQAFCAFMGKTKSFQNETDNAYKKLLQNQPHDSIYGCSIDAVHKENLQRYENIQQISNSIKNSVLRDLENDTTLSCINLSNYNFSGAVSIKTDKILPEKYNAQLIGKTNGFPLQKMYNIKQAPITEDYTFIYEYLVDLKNIDAFSTKIITDNCLQKNSTLNINNTTIENNKIALYVKNGKISVKNKITNEVYTNFIKLSDRADIGDSYNFGALKNDKQIYSKILNTKVILKGPIKSTLEIIFEINIPLNSTDKKRTKKVVKQKIKMLASLENQNDYIDFIISWENKCTNHLLQIEFNLKNNIEETFSDDLVSYTKRSFDYNYNIYKHIPAPKGIELKNNTAPLQKCVWTQGVGLITKGLQEYEIEKNKLLLTILRATGTISNPHNPTRGTPAGPPLPTPDLQMLKENNAEFALSFKNSIQELQPDVEKFYKSQILLFSEMQTANLIKINNKNVFVNTVKLDKKGNLIIRLINKSEKKQKCKIESDLKYSSIITTDAQEIQNCSIKNDYIEINAYSFLNILIKK